MLRTPATGVRTPRISAAPPRTSTAVTNMAAIAATFVTAVEVLGGAALILGVFTPIAGVLNMISLLGALVLVHVENGVFVENGGFELVLALFAGLAVIALLGAGKFSVDGLIGRTAAAR